MEKQQSKSREEIYLEEKEKLEEVEKRRAFLKDKSIGGENAPRPSDAYIDRKLGPELTQEQIIDKAGERADKLYSQQQKLEMQQAERLASIERHNRSIEERGKDAAQEQSASKENHGPER